MVSLCVSGARVRLVDDAIWGILTVLQEASSEPYSGKVAVAEVIQRRARERFFSDGTIPGTVLKPYQFSGWNSKDPNRIRVAKLDDSLPVVRDAIEAWHEAERGSDLTHGALLYYNPRIVPMPAWAYPEVAVQTAVIGSHQFYRPKGAT